MNDKKNEKKLFSVNNHINPRLITKSDRRKHKIIIGAAVQSSITIIVHVDNQGKQYHRSIIKAKK